MLNPRCTITARAQTLKKFLTNYKANKYSINSVKDYLEKFKIVISVVNCGPVI